MGYVVRMPQLGMTMEEGIVVDWLVDVGDAVEPGDTIVVIESEKTTNEVDAREDGTIVEQFVAREQPVPPGFPIAYVGEPDEEVPGAVRSEVEGDGADVPEAAAGTAQPATPTAGGDGAAPHDRRISPRARSFAEANDVQLDPLLDDIEGTGPAGAIIERDVIEVVETGAVAAPPPAATAAVEGRAIVEERGGSQLRQTIADRMTASAREAPQVTLNRRVPVDGLLAVKERLAADFDVDLSLSDFLVAAVVDAVETYPEFNAIYEDGSHKLAANVNVGIAVDVEGGLVTPVLRRADQLTLEEINRERSRLVTRAQSGDYTNDDFAYGTFTISNLGHFGVETFDPILNPPEVAILGVGTITTVVDPESYEPERRLGLSLTFDHRAVDGADAARFLDAIADALGHPLRLVSLDSAEIERAAGVEAMAFDSADVEAKDRRSARATHREGMQAAIQSGGFTWTADEPPELGGDDTAPSPVEQFLGSLASCLTLMISTVADRRDVPIDDIEVSVDATPDEGRIERLDVVVTLVSDADSQQLERVVGTAERACYVNDLIKEDIERTVDVEIAAP
jgi:pyruvate dehydrogenase E2 component (dihydrolipoamide acetyltransferase)